MFTYVMMLHKSAQRQSVGLIIVMMKITGFSVRESELNKVC